MNTLETSGVSLSYFAIKRHFHKNKYRLYNKVPTTDNVLIMLNRLSDFSHESDMKMRFYMTNII